MRVAAYIRVSTDDEEQESSFELQQAYFTRLLEEHAEWENAGVYSDYGISGTSAKERTGFQRLLRHCAEGRFDRIITKSVSRFARNTADLLKALQVMKEHDVSIFFEKENIDSTDPRGQFILTAMVAVAQEEARATSENILWGRQKRYQQGRVPNFDIYGYRFVGEKGRNRDVEIVEEEAKVVRWVFQSVANGSSYADLVRKLNQEHVPPPSTRPNAPQCSKRTTDTPPLWTRRQIEAMVRRERYVGDVLIQKTYVVDYLDHQRKYNYGDRPQYLIQNHHPAIVDREVYEKVQKIVESRHRPHKAYPDRLFTRRLVCSQCGRYYSSVRQGQAWRCWSMLQRNGQQVCTSEIIRETDLKRLIRKAIGIRFELTDTFLPDMIERLEQFQKTDHVERDRAFLKRQVADGFRDPEELERMERYWAQIERDRIFRDQAIEWMKTLKYPHQFLNESMPYIRAFVLQVTICSPSHIKVHWFDDSWTETEERSD